MKHIVVISNSFYPIMGPTSAVIEKYIKSLKKDYFFHIVTKTNKMHFEPSKDYDISYISSFRHKLYCQCLYNIENSHYKFVSKLILFFIRICLVIQTQYSFPTSRKWEINAYCNQLRKLCSKFEISAIIAVSDNFVIQLAMLKFKKENHNIKWISYILDPYSEYYIYYQYKMFKEFWKRANYKKEKEIYNAADYCLFSIEMYKYVANTFVMDPQKIFPIQFSLNKELSGGSISDTTEGCKLIYAGSFFRDIRNPEFALSILEKVSDIHLDMYVSHGECEDIIAKFVSEKIVRREFVDRIQYVDMIRNRYDIMVSVGNKSTLQAPSKMLELLSTGRPIINFSFSKDSQYEMIDKYPLGINIMYQESGAVDKVSDFCKKMKGKILPFEEVEKLYPDNSLKKQSDLLRKLIES